MDADKVLLALNLFDFVDRIKSERRNEILASDNSYSKFSYLIYATFYILDILRDLAIEKNIQLIPENLEVIKMLYPDAIKYIEEIIEIARKVGQIGRRGFAYDTFFKSPNPTTIYKDIRNSRKPKIEQIKFPFYQ